MNYLTEGKYPGCGLNYFEDICAIPHESKNEKGIADYLQAFAADRGLSCTVDPWLNVIIKKPASAGCEKKPGVILQGHTDMVCVKLPGVSHDFATDALPLVLDGEILRANGTTLGADNGTAVAHMLAILDDKDTFPHGPITCVFTSQEEIGLLGASHLDCSGIEADYLLAMDSGANREDVTTVSCAGGLVQNFSKAPVWMDNKDDTVTFTIGGMKGGHSAIEINKERGNAIKIMTRILTKIGREMPLHVVSFNGGSKMNAIAADAVATVCVEKADSAIAMAKELAAVIAGEIAPADPDFTFTAIPADKAPKAMDCKTTDDLLAFLYLMPNGARNYSTDIPGFVISSSNVGVITTTEDEIVICDFTRSAEDSIRDLIGDEIATLGEMFGFTNHISAKMSGWKFDPASKARALVQKLYKEMTGKEMILNASHGGMEMGEFISKMPHLDIVCFAPDCGNPHTPEEYLNIASFHNIYQLICKFLVEVSK